MRIVHLASEYPPQKVYGLGRFVQGLARAQARRGHEVHVVTNSMGGADREVNDEGATVHRVEFPPPPKPADSGSVVIQFNTQVLERCFAGSFCDAPDVVNAHDWLTALCGRAVSRTRKARFVVTVHDLIVGKRAGKLDNDDRFVGNLERWMCREADLLICVSRRTRREAVEKYDAPRERAHFIHNAVDARAFPEPDATSLAHFRSALDRGNPLALYVGRLDPEKGVDTLIDAVAELRRRGHRLDLVLAGGGAEEEALRERAERAGLAGTVRFLGYVSADSGVLNHLYRSADLLVAPSRYEPFGIVAVEAMACGLPVVASDTGGLREIVADGETGHLAPVGDPATLADRMAPLIEDKALRLKMGRKGRERALREFTWERTAERVDAILDGKTGTAPEEPPANKARPAAVPRKVSGRTLLLVQTHRPDFELLEANRVQFAEFARRGHLVRFLCYAGEGRDIERSWEGVASAIEADAPRGHEHLVRKTAEGYRRALETPWEWLVKMDSDALVTGDIEDFLRRHSEADMVGASSSFGPVLEAVRACGPPAIPADALDRLGGRYVRGFFYGMRRGALRRALPLVERMAPRMRVEDATFTACVAASGGRIAFADELRCYVPADRPVIDLRSPVVHFESRSASERRFFADRARALHQAAAGGTPQPDEAYAAPPERELSVVLHTRDRSELLLRLLGTLRCGWPPGDEAELIVVDYGGTDGLGKRLRGMDWPGLRYLYAASRGRFSSAHARNIGFRAATGRWILGLDSDLLVPAGFAATVLGHWRREPETAVYGPVFKLMPDSQGKLESGSLDPVRDFEELAREAAPHRIDPPSGAILGAPRSAILAVGGYDEEFTGYGFQDIDLIERLRRTGLGDRTPEGVFALHQFHGYPKDYNTAAIEGRNRARFLFLRGQAERNRGREWGGLPESGVDLRRVGWIEPTAYPRDSGQAGASRGSDEVIVWCEGAREDDVCLVAERSESMDSARLACRWVAESQDSLRLARRIAASRTGRTRFEVHTSGQVVTQFARARLVVLLASAAHAPDLAEACERLGVECIVAGVSARNGGAPAVSGEKLERRISEIAAQSKAGAQESENAEGRASAPVRKILVGMDEGIGNMVMLTPTLRAVKRLHPRAEIHVMGREPSLEAIRGWPVVAKALSPADRPDDWYDLLLVTGWRRGLKPRLDGIKFGRAPVVADPIRNDVHEAEQHMALARELGWTSPAPRTYAAWAEPDIGLPPRPRVGIADGANPDPQWRKKRWPHYRSLAQALLRQGISVVVLGDRADAEKYRSDGWPEGVIDLQGKLPLREAAGVVRGLDAVVCNDSGLAHVAAALGVRTLCLWGPTSRAKNAPRGRSVTNLSLDLPCSPCQGTPKWISCGDARCLRELSAERVADEVQSCLRAKRAPSRPCAVLFVGVFNDRSTNPSQARALESLGCRVVEYPYRERAKAIGPHARDREIADVCRRESPGLVLFSKANGVNSQAVRACSEETVTCLWYMDPMGNFDEEAKEKVRICAFSCFARRGPFEAAAAIGGDVHFVPEGFDEQVDRPVAADFRRDAAFIGSLRPDRLAYLRAVGFDAVSDAYGAAHARAVAETRVNLNFTEGDGASDRAYKVLAAGGFLLSQPWLGMEDCFMPGEDLDTFESPEELREKIAFYLANEELRRRIANHGRRTVQAYTRTAWAERILDIALRKETVHA